MKKLILIYSMMVLSGVGSSLYGAQNDEPAVSGVALPTICLPETVIRIMKTAEKPYDVKKILSKALLLAIEEKKFKEQIQIVRLFLEMGVPLPKVENTENVGGSQISPHDLEHLSTE
jgi:hypothetical protein